jgi:hypothetical protein
MMLQELYDRWTDIQKRYGESQTTESPPERIEEELNILEALRIFGGKAIPGETADVQVLITERHKKWDEVLRERKGISYVERTVKRREGHL